MQVWHHRGSAEHLVRVRTRWAAGLRTARLPAKTAVRSCVNVPSFAHRLFLNHCSGLLLGEPQSDSPLRALAQMSVSSKLGQQSHPPIWSSFRCMTHVLCVAANSTKKLELDITTKQGSEFFMEVLMFPVQCRPFRWRPPCGALRAVPPSGVARCSPCASEVGFPRPPRVDCCR